ncbi:hypothetical protein B0H14DRAFT_2638304 [Mycena olivaceomarginata]|nr:hypothetical protein B0H14DRAFT_2638304 [Mycena olivaceomarginata]
MSHAAPPPVSSARHQGCVPATAAAIADPPEPVEVKEEDHPTVFMEQLETYKANYDPSGPCGVNDEEPARSGLMWPNPAAIALSFPSLIPPDRRVGNPRWPSKESSMQLGALLFREAEPKLINPLALSPLRLSSQVSPNGTKRMNVNNRVAVCVTSGGGGGGE